MLFGAVQLTMILAGFISGKRISALQRLAIATAGTQRRWAMRRYSKLPNYTADCDE